MSFIPNFNQKVPITSSTSWTCPAGVYWALLTIWAGGGGGYLQSDNSTYFNAGGGGGGQWKQTLIPVVPGTTYWFIIGSGGTGFVSVTNTSGTATAGGNSYMYTTAAQTTLGSAISVTTSGFINLAAVTGLANGSIIQVDSEQMLILSTGTAGGGNTWVSRGWNGTTAATHSSGATVNLLNILALVFGGGNALSGAGGNGGGADGSSGGGANNTIANIGAGSGKPAQNGRGGTGAGGGCYSSGAPFSSPAGFTESALGFAWPNYGLSQFSIGGTTCSGGASWGPGVVGGDFSAAVVISPPPNTGGGGGGGTAGSSGGALIAYQAA